MKEKCIMPPNKWYSTERIPGLERNEVFPGVRNRKKCIEDGLVIFLTPEMHRTGKISFHKNPKFWKEIVEIQKIAQQAWMDYYDKSIADFIERYGRNYLD